MMLLPRLELRPELARPLEPLELSGTMPELDSPPVELRGVAEVPPAERVLLESLTPRELVLESGVVAPLTP